MHDRRRTGSEHREPIGSDMSGEVYDSSSELLGWLGFKS